MTEPLINSARALLKEIKAELEGVKAGYLKEAKEAAPINQTARFIYEGNAEGVNVAISIINNRLN